MLGCSHARAVTVESTVTGEPLAALCPDCDEQLPTDFLGCPHENVIETEALNEPPGRGICNGCGTNGWFGERAPKPYQPIVDTITYADLDDIPNSWL